MNQRNGEERISVQVHGVGQEDASGQLIDETPQRAAGAVNSPLFPGKYVYMVVYMYFIDICLHVFFISYVRMNLRTYVCMHVYVCM